MSQDAHVMRYSADSERKRFPAIDLTRDAILLDIDGTLLDIAPSPEAVGVPEAVRHSLSQLIANTDGALALVSGRTLASIDALFAPLRTAAIGCHGAQLRRSSEAEVEVRAPALPEPIRQACADIASLEPGVRVEDKTFALAFHYRQARDRERALLARLKERLAPFDSSYALMAGKFVFEVKPKNCDKGESLRALMHMAPFAGRRPVFFGDDTTDKYAFAALPEFGGFGVSVGHRIPHADFMLDSPRDVRHWLTILTRHSGETCNG
jgi:trehalose 6-phosphate phosphatase